MAVTALLYGLGFTSTFNKESDWNTDVPKCMLTTSAYIPTGKTAASAQDVDQFKNASLLVANEVTGTAYTAGGATLTTPTFLYTTGTNVWNYDTDDAVWTTATIASIRAAVVYNSTPATDATRPLMLAVEMGGDQTVSAANFTVQWAAAGLMAITLA
jgi:hypothetical protein